MADSLISGYLERILSNVFDDYPEAITLLIGKQRGIYSLYRKNSLYYVGLATDLRIRMKQHLKDRHAKKWDRFSLYLIHNAEHLKEVETILIRISEPRGNVSRGGFKKSRNLIRELRILMKNRNREKMSAILSGKKSEIKASTSKGKKNVKRPGMRGVPRLAGLLPVGTGLMVMYKGKKYTAEVDEKGMIHIDDKVYNSPSLAGFHVTKRPTDGWLFWKFQDITGQWVKIDLLRKVKS